MDMPKARSQERKCAQESAHAFLRPQGAYDPDHRLRSRRAFLGEENPGIDAVRAHLNLTARNALVLDQMRSHGFAVYDDAVGDVVGQTEEAPVNPRSQIAV